MNFSPDLVILSQQSWCHLGESACFIVLACVCWRFSSLTSLETQLEPKSNYFLNQVPNYEEEEGEDFPPIVTTTMEKVDSACFPPYKFVKFLENFPKILYLIPSPKTYFQQPTRIHLLRSNSTWRRHVWFVLSWFSCFVSLSLKIKMQGSDWSLNWSGKWKCQNQRLEENLRKIPSTKLTSLRNRFQIS